MRYASIPAQNSKLINHPVSPKYYFSHITVIHLLMNLNTPKLSVWFVVWHSENRDWNGSNDIIVGKAKSKVSPEPISGSYFF